MTWTPGGRPGGVYVMLWIEPRDGIASPEIKRNGGGWLLRYHDGDNHDGPVNLTLPKRAPAADVAAWPAAQVGEPRLTVVDSKRPAWWKPAVFRDCGETFAHHMVTPVNPLSSGR